MHTVCMDTRDAVRRGEGEFSMRLAGDNPRFQAVKVALGSLEFPMVQYTIEEDWNRVYFSEGFRITNESRHLRIHEHVDEATYNDIEVLLPLHLNEIVQIRRHHNGSVVKCSEAHGLWTSKGRCVIAAVDWSDVEILCSSLGRVSLTACYNSNRLAYVSDCEFLIVGSSDGLEAGGGVLHVPTYPSPTTLCSTIGYILTYSDALASYDCVYDPVENKASIQATMFPAEAATLMIRVYGSDLATLLGYPSAMHEKRFVQRRAPSSLQEAVAFDFFVEAGDVPPLCVPSERFEGWHYVELEPGWYAPSQRPMCTGQPLRLNQEIEKAMNRLNFPVPDRVPQGMPTSHFLMFTDPSGNIHNLCVYPGRYTAEAFADMLETEMNRLSSPVSTVFTVDYDDEKRFVFQCEVREKGVVKAANFGLLLDHPAQFDPARIGFPAVSLNGRDSYTSPYRVPMPSGASHILRPSTNTYTASEIGHQKRIRLQPTPPMQFIGVILNYEVETDVLTLRTYASQLPMAHGLQPGDVVGLSNADETELFAYAENKWVSQKVVACPIAPSSGRSGVVVRNARASNTPPSSEFIEVSIRVRPTRSLTNHIGKVVSLQVGIEPFNLCFGLPKSVPAVNLGFPAGATQWGIDGAITSGKYQIPPFDAPFVHSLDHPDYVLLSFNEGKLSTGLQHRHGNHTSTPFAKLVLYPMFREERMLPRESMLLSGESLTVFTIRFTNPDGSPYHFHGANFSFSLNFVKAQE